jgi:transcriptional regulator with PAS, ATPase and Fis domain
MKIYTAKVNKKMPDVEQGFFKLLSQHKWNGNIRELKNVIERVIILMDEPLLTPKLLPYEFHNGGYFDLVALDLDSVEKHHIRRILKYTNGNKSEAARILGIGIATLYRKIEEYQLLLN